MKTTWDRRALLVLILIVVLFGVLTHLRQIEAEGWKFILANLTLLTTVWAALFYVAGHFGPIKSFVQRTPTPAPAELGLARERLRAALLIPWTEEVPTLYQNEPMPVRFGPANEYLLVDEDRPNADSYAGGFAGGFAGVAQAFAVEPRYRRVLLGERGAGKSVLIAELQRVLLETPGDAEPLPVIMRVESWQPKQQPLLDWLVSQLTKSHDWLRVKAARAMLVRGIILPVLDGLDDLPLEQRGSAIAAINRYLIHRPLIVTSRKREYRTAVERHGFGVKASVVLQIEPLGAADVNKYLTRNSSGTWADMFVGLTDDAPLVQALSRPLKLYFAWFEYAGRNPRELALFGTRKALSKHLQRGCVPAAYAARQTDPAPPRWTELLLGPRLSRLVTAAYAARKINPTPRQAQRWLGRLSVHARDMGQVQAKPLARLAWWHFHAGAGRWRYAGIAVRAALRIVVLCAVAVWVLRQTGNWAHGGYAGTLNFTKLFLGGPAARFVEPTAHILATDIGARLSGAALARWIFTHRLLSVTALTGLAAYLTFALHYGPTREPSRLRLRAGLVLGAAVTGMIWAFGIACVVTAIALWIGHGHVSIVAFYSARSTWIALGTLSLLGLVNVPIGCVVRSDTLGSLIPLESLRLDRAADAASTIARRGLIAVAAWLLCGRIIMDAWLYYAVAATLLSLLLGGQRSFASRSYADARIWLRLNDRAPWRIMAFLQDASTRGVLVPAGAAYQFRHASLLDLVDEWMDQSTPLPEWQARWTAWTAWVPTRTGGSGQDDLAAITERADSFLSGHGAADLARAFDQFARRLSAHRGDPPKDSITQLLDRYERLAEYSPEVFALGWARAVRWLGPGLDLETWYRMSADACLTCWALTVTDPDAYPIGAEAAWAHALVLEKLGQLEEFRQLGQEVVAVARERAPSSPAAHAVLADAFQRLAPALSDDETVAAFHEAVDMYQVLAAADPDRYLARRCGASRDLIAWSRQHERPDDERAACLEAVAAYRQEAEHIAALRRQVAAGLGRTATNRSKTLERVAEAQGDAHAQLDLWQALLDLAVELRARGRWRTARAVRRTAGHVLEEYLLRAGVSQQETLLKWLPNQLDALARRLWELGAHEAALAAGRDARALAPTQPWRLSGRVAAYARLGWLFLTLHFGSKRPENLADLAKKLDRFTYARGVAGLVRPARLAASLSIRAQKRSVDLAETQGTQKTGPADAALSRLQAAYQILSA